MWRASNRDVAAELTKVFSRRRYRDQVLVVRIAGC